MFTIHETLDRPRLFLAKRPRLTDAKNLARTRHRATGAAYYVRDCLGGLRFEIWTGKEGHTLERAAR